MILFCNPNKHVAHTGQTALSESVLIRNESQTKELLGNCMWMRLPRQHQTLKHPGRSLFVEKEVGDPTGSVCSVGGMWWRKYTIKANSDSDRCVCDGLQYPLSWGIPPAGVKLIRQFKIKRASLSVLTAAKLLCLGLLWAVIKTDIYKYRMGRCTGHGFLTCTGTCVYMLAKQDTCMKHHFSPFGHQIYCSVFFHKLLILLILPNE